MSTEVVATEYGDESTQSSVVIENDYVLVCDGTAHCANVVVHLLKNGTRTHVITIKGIRPKGR